MDLESGWRFDILYYTEMIKGQIEKVLIFLKKI